MTFRELLEAHGTARLARSVGFTRQSLHQVKSGAPPSARLLARCMVCFPELDLAATLAAEYPDEVDAVVPEADRVAAAMLEDASDDVRHCLRRLLGEESQAA